MKELKQIDEITFIGQIHTKTRLVIIENRMSAASGVRNSKWILAKPMKIARKPEK